MPISPWYNLFFIPGEKVLVPGPKTQAEMEEREKISGPDKKTWYLLMKDL